jgi:hypothetical protein
MGTHQAATATHLRGTLHNRGTLRNRGTRHREEPTLLGRTHLHLELTPHSSMATLRPAAATRRNTVAIHLQVTPAHPRRTRVMGVATAGVVDTWGRC